MHKKLLRSVLAAAFSAIVAAGVLGGLGTATTQGAGDSSWSAPSIAEAPAAPADSSWN